MWALIVAIVPMFVLFLIPIAIPIVAVALGAITDRAHPHVASAAEAAVVAARARSAPRREEMARRLRETSSANPAVVAAPRQKASGTIHLLRRGWGFHHGGHRAA